MWRVLAVVLLATAAGAVDTNRMDDVRYNFPWEIQYGPLIFQQLEGPVTDVPDGTETFCLDCIPCSDPCAPDPTYPGCAMVNPPTCGAFAFRNKSAWHCNVGCGLQCLSCADAATCGSGNGCLPPFQICNQNIDCCSTQCVNGFCGTGQCANTGDFCTSNGDCCAGLLCQIDQTCQASTTTTTSTTTTSTAGVSTTTTTSTSSTTSTSTTLALSGPVGMFLPLPATLLEPTVSPRLLCVVLRTTAGISANHLAAAFKGTGFCTVVVYPDSDTGTLLASVTKACPNPGIVTNTGGLLPFTLNGGAQYRFCVCSSNSTTGVLELYGTLETTLETKYSVSLGASTTTCDTGNGTPPGTTGALTPLSGVNLPGVPFVWVEQ